MVLDPPTNGDGCRPIAVISLLEAFADAGIGDVEIGLAEGWTGQPLIKPAVKWSGTSLSPPAQPGVRLGGYDLPHYTSPLPGKLPAYGRLEV